MCESEGAGGVAIQRLPYREKNKLLVRNNCSISSSVQAKSMNLYGIRLPLRMTVAKLPDPLKTPSIGGGDFGLPNATVKRRTK